MSRWLRYLIPVTIVTGFLCSFFYEVLHYTVILDDCFFDAITHKLGLWKSMVYCFNVANGRWFSHLVTCVFFAFAGHNFTLYAVLLSLLVLLFVCAIAIFIRNYFREFKDKDIRWLNALGYGFFITAFLYFVLYAGRREAWCWLSAATNHLLSTGLSILLIGLLFKKDPPFLYMVLCGFVSLAVGGLNEVNALSTMALLFIGLFSFADTRKKRIAMVLSLVSISVSLVVNFTSAGYRIRMEGLPSFALGQALKNSLHSLLMPFLELEPMAMLFIAGILVYALFSFFIQRSSFKDHLLPENTAFFLFWGVLAFSVFLHCYVLSDVIPARAALWAAAATLLYVFRDLPLKLTATAQ